MTTKELTIIKRERPFSSDLQDQIRWLLASLGIPERFAKDYAGILVRIASQSSEERLSTGILAEEFGTKRTSLSYHINRLVNMGIIVREGRSLRLRASNFERTVEEIERDVIRMFEDMKKVAREIDALLGLPRR